jgi:hypothetical protein
LEGTLSFISGIKLVITSDAKAAGKSMLHLAYCASKMAIKRSRVLTSELVPVVTNAGFQVYDTYHEELPGLRHLLDPFF